MNRCLGYILAVFCTWQNIALAAPTPYSLVLSEYANTGLFANFYAVLGLLDYYDKGSDPALVGVKIDFGKTGLYYEQSKGPNFWNYYFEPIDICSNPSAEKKCIPDIIGHGDPYRPTESVSNFSAAGALLTRTRASELIQKYIKIVPPIFKKIDSFFLENFKDKYVIGIHYRGTDKEEVKRVTYKQVATKLDRFIKKSNRKDYLIFVATDEDAFLQYMLVKYKGKVVCASTLRSKDGAPVHFWNPNNYQKGEEALIDCVLLSRCNYVIRTTASALSACSTCFNPNLSESQIKTEIVQAVTPYSTCK